MRERTRVVPAFVVPRPRRVLGSIRARVLRPSISSAEARNVLDQFEIALVGFPRNLPLSWRNDLAIVRTSSGLKVLKRYRSSSSIDRIVHEHSIINELLAHEFAVTGLNHTPLGETVIEVDGRAHALFDHASGTHFAGSYLTRRQRGALLHIAGATLGRFHATLQRFQPSGSHDLGVHPGSDLQRLDLAWYHDTLDRLRDSGAGHVDDPHTADIVHRLCLRATSLRTEIEDAEMMLDHARLPLTTIHGDYGLHNLLFRRDGSALVHDLELSRRDWRLLDIVISFVRLPAWGQQLFIEGYRSTNDLPGGELASLVAAWRYHLLTGAVRSWDGFERHGGVERLRTACARLGALPEIDMRVATS